MEKAMASARNLMWVVLLLLVSSNNAGAGILQLSLGSPSVDGGMVEYALVGNFTPDGADEMFDYQIDLAGTSDELTANGSDFSRFTLTPAAGLIDWMVLANFGEPVVNVSLAQATTFDQTLSAGSHLLGTIQVDISNLDVSPGALVRIDGPDTAAASDDDPFLSGGIVDLEITFGQAAQGLPEPSSMISCLVLFSACLARRSGSQASNRRSIYETGSQYCRHRD